MNKFRSAYGWLRFVLALVLGACASSDPDAGTGSSASAVVPADACSLVELDHAPPGACFHVAASQNSILVACESTLPANETQVTRGPGYVVTAFDVAGGDCFGWYACVPTAVEAPQVTPCP